MDKQQLALVFGAILAPVATWFYLKSGEKGRQFIERYMPDGRIKRLLLKKVD